MVSDTSVATVARLAPVVSISRSGTNETNGRTAVPEAKALPEEGRSVSQVQPSSRADSPVKQSHGPTGIQEAVREINEFVQNVQRDLSFDMDEVSGRTVIKVIDRDSGDTVRQIPSEEVLEIARSIRDVRNSAVGHEAMPPGLLFSRNT